jgi:hypothetical protein
MKTKNIESLLDSGENADLEVNTGEIITLCTLSTNIKQIHNIKVDNKSSEKVA